VEVVGRLPSTPPPRAVSGSFGQDSNDSPRREVHH
jgi:hypothetical protein